MAVEIRVPSVGESITEVTVAEWLKREGDPVEQDEPLVSLETDKANVDVPAPASGRVARIAKRAGETAAIGESLGEIETEGAAAGAQTANGGEAARPEPAAAPTPQAAPPAPPPAAAASPPPHADAGPVVPARPEPPGAAEATGTPMSSFRMRMAERLVQARLSAVALTVVEEIDCSSLPFHDRLATLARAVRASVWALREFPDLNAELSGDRVCRHARADVAVVLSPEGSGPVAPVISDAGSRNVEQIESALRDFSRRAFEGRLRPAELSGGTFSLDDLGPLGALLSTPVLTPPHTGALGLHAVRHRPVGVAGRIELRPMMYVALSFDQRLVDAATAAAFLRRLRDLLEAGGSAPR